ncbi:hypothetical protein [Stackebrandtia nassauensis]|uniref:Uncharacterized protein n=1 Tax=Stackebrandtia nassauensis (strain DSM 44728 / CIP 108903 / NRRL B-16338 / NBRC 102104 / LLR-40K-21) TaxID=446470 RepID=D3Q676_STANL|nr:hypothetical protein [Stackebrandtia nassauensis]ADD42251.1 hypothetical protein Snas_2571 [Stackebrandtia nassauensis DSM 44728]
MTAPTARPVRVTANLLRSQWWVAAIFWGGLYLLFLTIGVIVSATAGMKESVWIGACWWSQYLMLAAGTVVTSQYVRIFVGHGVTRRTLTIGAVLYGLAGSALFGVLMELGFLAERGIAMAQGLPPFPAATEFVASPARMLESTVEFTLLHVAYFFAGWLISVTFYRHGGVAGIAVIVPALLPGLFMDVVKLGDKPLSELFASVDLTGLPQVVAVSADALSVAVLALLCLLLTRTVPIRST